MRTLIRFGSGSRVYTFPTLSQVTFTDNFASLVTKTIRLAGVHGGHSNLGTGPGLHPIGTVRVDNWLTFNDLVEATDKVDSLRAMADWGLQPLFMQPTYGAERWCWARLTDAQMQQNVVNVPHLRQKVPVVFEVPDSFWYAKGTELIWGSGWKWGDGSKWGSSVAATSVTGSGTITVTPGGNAFTLAKLIITNSSGANVSDIIIRRIVNGAVADEVTYLTTLATGTYLVIDPRRRRVVLGPVGTSVLSAFTSLNPDWMRLLPGANSLQVILTGTATVGVRYLERYT